MLAKILVNGIVVNFIIAATQLVANSPVDTFSKLFYYKKGIKEPCIHLDDIDFDKVKKGHYFTRSNGREFFLLSDPAVVIKLWPADYNYSKFFVNALKKNFYDGLTPPFCCIFDSNENSRGYIMKRISNKTAVIRTTTDNPDIIKLNRRIHEADFLENQTQEFQDLVHKLIKKFYVTGLVYLDLYSRNILYDEDELKLIDLELIFTPEEFLQPRYVLRDLYASFPPEYKKALGNDNYQLWLSLITASKPQKKRKGKEIPHAKKRPRKKKQKTKKPKKARPIH